MKCQVCGKDLQKVVTALPFKLGKERILERSDASAELEILRYAT